MLKEDRGPRFVDSGDVAADFDGGDHTANLIQIGLIGLELGSRYGDPVAQRRDHHVLIRHNKGRGRQLN